MSWCVQLQIMVEVFKKTAKTKQNKIGHTPILEKETLENQTLESITQLSRELFRKLYTQPLFI